MCNGKSLLASSLCHILAAHCFLQKFLNDSYFCNDLVCGRMKRPICLFCKLIKAGFRLAQWPTGSGPRTRKIRDCIRVGEKGVAGDNNRERLKMVNSKLLILKMFKTKYVVLTFVFPTLFFVWKKSCI